MTIKQLVKSGYPLTVGFLVAGIGVVLGASGMDRKFASYIFLSGWVIAAPAMIIRILLSDADSPMRRPLKVSAMGFALVAIAGLPEFFGIGAIDWLFYAGALVVLLGIVWGLFNVRSSQ